MPNKIIAQVIKGKYKNKEIEIKLGKSSKDTEIYIGGKKCFGVTKLNIQCTAGNGGLDSRTLLTLEIIEL